MALWFLSSVNVLGICSRPRAVAGTSTLVHQEVPKPRHRVLLGVLKVYTSSLSVSGAGEAALGVAVGSQAREAVGTVPGTLACCARLSWLETGSTGTAPASLLGLHVPVALAKFLNGCVAPS